MLFILGDYPVILCHILPNIKRKMDLDRNEKLKKFRVHLFFLVYYCQQMFMNDEDERF